jgi:hypothetical protein
VPEINNLALKGKVCWYKKSIKLGCCAQNFILALKSKAFVDPKKGNKQIFDLLFQKYNF